MSDAKHRLTVILHHAVAGHLRLVAGKLSFQYLPNYLADSSAKALSFALPLQAHAFDEQPSKAFFGGLLPEGKLRAVLSRQFGFSQQNDFALLREIGGECAGAVSLQMGDEVQLTDAASLTRWLSNTELGTLIQELPQRPMLGGQDGLRLSLAGAQDKLPVRLGKNNHNDLYSIGLASAGAPSTHIMKPAIAGLTDTVQNELFCMSLARYIGINASPTFLVPSGADAIFLTERYDRVLLSNQTVTRLHQEDICQALGISAHTKYQTEGGPSLGDCFDLMRRATNNSAMSILSLQDYVIFNTLVGNHDAHGKNFSLLYRGGKTELAPLYDCLSTAVYPTLTPKMAMSIGGKYLFSDLRAKHWEQFSKDTGLSPSLTKRRILFFTQKLPALARKAATLQAGGLFDSPITNGICNLLEQRCAMTVKHIG